MALKAQQLTREFTFNKGGNGTKVILPDPNPDFTTQEVIDFYSGQYPELTTAKFEEPKVVDNKQVYSVKTTVGTKA